MVVLSTGVVNLGQQAKRLHLKNNESVDIYDYIHIYTYMHICQSSTFWFLAREYVGDCASMGLFSCFLLSRNLAEAWTLSGELVSKFNDWLDKKTVRCEALEELQHESLDETVEGRRWWQAEFAWIYSLIWLVCVWLVSRSRQFKLQFWDIYCNRPAIADFHG